MSYGPNSDDRIQIIQRLEDCIAEYIRKVRRASLIGTATALFSLRAQDNNLGILRAVLDNNYGKVRDLMKAVFAGSEIFSLSDNLDEGVAWARQQALSSNA